MAERRAKELDVAERASLLKRAGLPTAATVLILLLSTPGFYERFFNTVDEEALAKADLSYQLLKAQTEALAKQIEINSVEVGKLRDLVNSMLLQRSAVGLGVGRAIAEPAAQLEVRPLPANLDKMAAAVMDAE